MKKGEKKIINGRIFQWTICDCGCKKYYWKWLNPEEPSGYEIISYRKNIVGSGYGNNPATFELPCEIKRLKDGVIFKLGCLIQRITPMGKKYGKCILENIQVEENGFMQLHCYCIDGVGSAVIRNDPTWMSSGEDPNIFNIILNVSKSS